VIAEVAEKVGSTFQETLDIRTFLALRLESLLEGMTPLPPAVGPGDPSIGGVSGLPGSGLG
jgi:hypothetical protein